MIKALSWQTSSYSIEHLHRKLILTRSTYAFRINPTPSQVRELVVFYRINYNSWCSSEKRSVRIKVSSMIPIIWLVVLGAGGDYALYAQVSQFLIFDVL